MHKTYISMAIAALVAVATALSADVQALWAAHPAVSAAVAGVYAMIAHYLPSPNGPAA